jgi:hypothetical protein
VDKALTKGIIYEVANELEGKIDTDILFEVLDLSICGLGKGLRPCGVWKGYDDKLKLSLSAP